MDPNDIVEWTNDGMSLKRLNIKLSFVQWDEFCLSDVLASDQGWHAPTALENYLAVERNAPVFLAMTETVEDAFAGEEFNDEF